MKYADVLFMCGDNERYADALWFQIEQLNSQSFWAGAVVGGSLSAVIVVGVIYAVRYL